MTGVEIGALVFGGSVGLASGWAAWRHARAAVKRAEALRKEGWVCVGVNFFAGPLMVPPFPSLHNPDHEHPRDNLDAGGCR